MELDKIVTTDPNKVTTYTFHSLTIKRTSTNGITSALRWSIRNGYPRAILVKDDKLRSDDKDVRFSNYVTFPLDSIRLVAAVTEWLKIIRSGKESESIAMNIFYPKTENGIVNSNFIGKLVFGVNKGVPFIGIVTGEQNAIVFSFTADTPYVEFERNQEKTNMNREVAASYGQALIRHLEGTYMKYSNVFVSEKKDGYVKDVKFEEPQVQQQPQRTYPQQPQQPVQQPQPEVQVQVQQEQPQVNYAEQMMDGSIEM